MTTDAQPLTSWEIELMDAEIADLSAEVPCTACERGAEWIARFPCGECADIVCPAHKTEQDQRHDAAASAGQWWECKRHHIRLPHPLPWRPL